MTQPGKSKCPRCGQPITFRKDGCTIYPHRDSIVGASCPMGGVDFDYARRQVDEAGAELARLRREVAAG